MHHFQRVRRSEANFVQVSWNEINADVGQNRMNLVKVSGHVEWRIVDGAMRHPT
jgi:hypothetical protein